MAFAISVHSLRNTLSDIGRLGMQNRKVTSMTPLMSSWTLLPAMAEGPSFSRHDQGSQIRDGQLPSPEWLRNAEQTDLLEAALHGWLRNSGTFALQPQSLTVQTLANKAAYFQLNAQSKNMYMGFWGFGVLGFLGFLGFGVCVGLVFSLHCIRF